MEALLHYLWHHKRYRSLVPKGTLAGSAVSVLHPGVPNDDAGPDFFNAKIYIDDLLWVGNVEIHLKSSDWHQHGHQHDMQYNNCVLHVVSVYDKEAYMEQGVPVATCEMEVDESLLQKAAALVKDGPLACGSRIGQLSLMEQHRWMDRLMAERLEQKAQEVSYFYASSDGEWSQAFYLVLMRYFGFKVNNEAMERLARSLPFRLLQKHRNNLLQLEAMLMGQAGLLREIEPTADAYLVRLADEYRFLAHKFSLKPLPEGVFRFHRIRPVASPYRRLAQLAAMFHRHEWLADSCLHFDKLADLEALFRVPLTGYWQQHTSPGSCALKGGQKGMGTISVEAYRLLVVNVVAPFLYAYGRERKEPAYEEKALGLYELLPAEDNRDIRRFNACGIKAEHAGDSQALLQLVRHYCEPKRCFLCQWGRVLLASDIR